MSMIGNLLRVTREELDSYLQDSSLLEKNIHLVETEEGNPKLVDIDQSWDGITFLQTGQSSSGEEGHPSKKVFFSGQLVDPDQDLGYGPAHYLTPERVVELNSQLASLTREDLAKRYDADKMTELHIYPNIWQMDEVQDYLLEYFESVQEVFALAAQNDEAIITFIN